MDRLIETGLVAGDFPIGPLTTYKAGGNARFFADISTEDELDSLIGPGLPADLEVLIIGRGSNLVVADSGFDGLAIRLGGRFTDIELIGDVVTAGGATPLPRLARSVVDTGKVGLEFFVGVPGSVGGAVRQNAGCFGFETVDVLIDAAVLDLRTGARSVRDASAFELSYRHSNVSSTELVLSARFAVSAGDVDDARERMRDVTRWRKEHQPGGTFNAGSVFKNPEGDTAGAIIDRLGLKGTSVGDVRVSEKHANFFVAGPSATSGDIAELVAVVKDAVLRHTGTKLETEIQFVGFGQ